MAEGAESAAVRPTGQLLVSQGARERRLSAITEVVSDSS